MKPVQVGYIEVSQSRNRSNIVRDIIPVLFVMLFIFRFAESTSCVNTYLLGEQGTLTVTPLSAAIGDRTTFTFVGSGWRGPLNCTPYPETMQYYYKASLSYWDPVLGSTGKEWYLTGLFSWTTDPWPQPSGSFTIEPEYFTNASPNSRYATIWVELWAISNQYGWPPPWTRHEDIPMTSVQLILPSVDSKATLITGPTTVKIRAQALSIATPQDDVTVYLRVHDPADPSPYRTDAMVGDNGARLASIPCSDGCQTATIDLDGNGSIDSSEKGVVETNLVLPSNAYGGDNYQVEASTSSSFACGDNCAKGKTITAWRKEYFEHTPMYKQGQFIISNANAGSSTITVADVNKFKKEGGNWPSVHLFSATNPIGERGVVTGTNSRTGTVTILWQSPGGVLANSYNTGNSGSCNGGASCVAVPYSFLANTSKGTYDGNPNSASLALAFDDTYVQWTNSGAAYFMPTWDNIPGATDRDIQLFIADRSPWYFKNASNHNYVQLVSAGGSSDSSLLGLTEQIERWSWIFLNTAITTNPIQQTIAHELAHQWNVNQGDSQHHDDESAWNGGPCLMNRNADENLGVIKFHSNLNAPVMDLYCIRGHSDDLNTETCSWP